MKIAAMTLMAAMVARGLAWPSARNGRMQTGGCKRTCSREDGMPTESPARELLRFFFEAWKRGDSIEPGGHFEANVLKEFASRRHHTYVRWLILLGLAFAVRAQDHETLPAPSVSEKWRVFVDETVSPLTPGAAAFNAGVSQATHSSPLYGREVWPAYPKRFASSMGDILSQNFLGDFLLASALHEDTRYRRRGESHRLWPRIGYAISRAVVTRTDSGETTFNWSNVEGTAMSAALSTAYYPPASRTASAAATNWGTSVAGSGLANLMPEFWPDFRRWVKRRLRLRH
jgi:hypothetical protein